VVNGGRTPRRPSWVAGVGCTRATGRRPSEGGEGCAQSSRSGREGGPKRDHNFSTMPTVPNSDPRRLCNTCDQSHRGHYFDDNPRLRPTHCRKKGVADRANAKQGSEASAERGGGRAQCPLETWTPGPEDMIREVRQEVEGAAHRECGCSSLRVRVQPTESAGAAH